MTWTHLRDLISIDDPLKRQLYIGMCGPLEHPNAEGEALATWRQMELYLRWLDKHERLPGENPPLGLILCADKNEEQVELLELDKGRLRVASYLTELPPRELLQRKLLNSVAFARAQTNTPPEIDEMAPPLIPQEE
ncbi:MAG: DUF1016 domain-containing protein [Myxococcales bacterium]|nr:DUF1016 domain-containing protein [Myxococcales bacterium]